MNKPSLLSILLAGCLAFSACSDDAERLLPVPQDLPGELVDIESLSGIQHDIAVNVLASHYGGYRKGMKLTRASDDFTITPLVIEEIICRINKI